MSGRVLQVLHPLAEGPEPGLYPCLWPPVWPVHYLLYPDQHHLYGNRVPQHATGTRGCHHMGQLCMSKIKKLLKIDTVYPVIFVAIFFLLFFYDTFHITKKYNSLKLYQLGFFFLYACIRNFLNRKNEWCKNRTVTSLLHFWKFCGFREK